MSWTLHTSKEYTMYISQHTISFLLPGLFYVAPEHLQTDPRKNVSKAGDVFSFGVILYEIITRAGPYDEDMLPMLGNVYHNLILHEYVGTTFEDRTRQQTQYENRHTLWGGCIHPHIRHILIISIRHDCFYSFLAVCKVQWQIHFVFVNVLFFLSLASPDYS